MTTNLGTICEIKIYARMPKCPMGIFILVINSAQMPKFGHLGILQNAQRFYPLYNAQMPKCPKCGSPRSEFGPPTFGPKSYFLGSFNILKKFALENRGSYIFYAFRLFAIEYMFFF